MDNGQKPTGIRSGLPDFALAARRDLPLAKRLLRLGHGSVNSFCVAVWLCLGLLGLGVAPARAAGFAASLDRDTISLGETATLSLTFEGGQPKNVPTPDVPGLRIVNVGNSQNFSLINNQMSSTVTITFSVTPQRTGEFTIPAMTADVNGQRLASPPLKLTVLKANAPSAAAVNSGSEVAFMKLVLPDQRVYVGQTIVAQAQIFLRDDVQNFGNFRFTATPADGFVIGKSAQGGRYRTQIGNRAYTVIPISLVLTVLKAGSLNLGPFTAEMTVVLPSSQPPDPFLQRFGFRSPFFDNGEQKPVSLATDPIEIQALPLPAEDRPANFNGAIGHYTMTATAGPTNVAVGDPITVRIQISGRGALDSLTLPNEPAWRDFKTYPPTSKVEVSDPLGLDGAKTFEEIVAPQNTDVHQLPPFSFSFFDPGEGKYHTLTQPGVEIAVHSAGMAPAPVMAAAKIAGAENPPSPRDILPIKEEFGTVVAAAPPLVARPGFLAWQGLPVLAWLAAFVWRKRAESLANNPRLRRRRHVEKLIQTGLADLEKFAAANNSDEFFAALFRLLQEQLGERLDCPASSITEAVVDDRLARLGAEPATLESLRELFQRCNQARYAPIRGSAELDSVARQFEKVISELQELKV
jgi:hypothetical protein